MSLAFLWAGLLALDAHADPPASEPVQKTVLGSAEPIEMTAKGRLRVDLKRQLGIAERDVVIRRRDVIVCCDKAEAAYEGDQITRVECRGRVAIVRPDGTRARADAAVFEAKIDLLTLSGSARVRAPTADLVGEVITYDVARDVLEVSGGPSRFRFKPSEPMADERPCPP